MTRSYKSRTSVRQQAENRPHGYNPSPAPHFRSRHAPRGKLPARAAHPLSGERGAGGCAWCRLPS
ncbi:hypothetical protein CFR80_01880, partial [Komagataeibacter oboediens]